MPKYPVYPVEVLDRLSVPVAAGDSIVPAISVSVTEIFVTLTLAVAVVYVKPDTPAKALPFLYCIEKSGPLGVAVAAQVPSALRKLVVPPPLAGAKPSCELVKTE
jgi:hypothetical protein